MFGFGGIFVEVFKDVSFRVAPVDKFSAYRIIDETKASLLLKGARGRPKRDIETLAVCLQRLSQLALECPQIKELDINPMMVLEEGKGCFVADAKIML
jgi:acyl-CoA synthetase (NDP forming)